MRLKLRSVAMLALALGATAPACWACSIPVFRYALERWPAEPYYAVVFHKGPLGPAERAAVDALRKAAEGEGEGSGVYQGASEGARANLWVSTVDVAAPRKGKQAEKPPKDAKLPWLVVRYPYSLRVERPAWAGPLTAENVKALLDSPVRRQILKRLAAGDCGVWLLVECGDKARDDAAAKVLKKTLAKLEEMLELPEQDPGVFGGPPDGGDDADAPPKLKVSFSMLRVAANDPAEKMFLDTLLSLDPELRQEGKPLALAVFGQGRALPALLGDGINEDNIADICAFMVGPCSCQVKAMNPGWDVLMTADWMAVIEAPLVAEEPEPELVGSVPTPLTPAEKAEAQEPAPVAQTEASEPPPPEGHLVRNVVLAAVAGVVILAIASVALLRRGTREE